MLLGMPDGAPPPWLVSMQRYGPPQSYPALKIPGLNAPIPLGAKFGYQPGGWGKPPVDENNCPIYGGDVFGVPLPQKDELNYEDEPVDKSKHWGDLEEEEEVEEEEEEEEEAMEDGIQSVDSVSDVVDDVIDLRKQARKEEDRPLYQVLDEKEASIGSGTLLGTTHTYAVPVAMRVDLLRSQKTDEVDVTLAPEELEDIDDVLPAKYEEAREVEKLRNKPEDFSDMVAENPMKRKRKTQEKDSRSKKKTFKF